MEPDRREAERAGLCATCQYDRIVRSDRGSVFHQCQRAATDPSFPQYPNLPVLHCRGYELKSGGQASNTSGQK